MWLASQVPIKRSRVFLGDGRILDLLVAGPEDGTVLVFHHGTPGSMYLFEPFIEAAAARNLRYLSYSRPGYGDSTRQLNRTVADCAKDTAEILNHLGTDRCFVIGWSGGGPHALACAALMPDRVISSASIAGIAPWGAEGLDWLAGTGKENVEEFGAALAGPDKLQKFLERMGPVFARVTGKEIIAAFGDLVGDVDKAMLTGEVGEFLAGNTREGLRNGFWGWFDDDYAFLRDWGFDLSHIEVPVSVWHGAQDRMAPFAHGRWLAEHLPNARAHLLPDHGHLSLAVGSFNNILDELMADEKR